MFRAVKNNDVETIKKLKEAEVDIDVRDNKGRTALHLAVLYNYPEVARTLLDAGAYSEVINILWNAIHYT